MSKDFWKETIKNILIFLIFPLCCVALGFYLNQEYFNQNQVTIQQWTLKKELVKEQYPYLNRILRMVDIVRYRIELERSKETVYVNNEKETLAKVEKIYTFKMYTFSIDKNLQEEWLRLGKEIDEHLYKISPKLHYKFKRVYNYKDSHPFPTNTTIKELKDSDWVREDSFTHFDSLNIELWQATMDVLNLEHIHDPETIYNGIDPEK